MIGYHPALDPYHTAYRLLRILSAIDAPIMEDALRILDFFLIFPEAIPSIQLPRAHVGWKNRFEVPKNEYWLAGDRKIVFDQMRGVQEASIGLLQGSGWIWRTDNDHIQLSQLPPALSEDIAEANETDSELMRFLTEVLGQTKVFGNRGLKMRTGLMEYRYDANA